MSGTQGCDVETVWEAQRQRERQNERESHSPGFRAVPGVPSSSEDEDDEQSPLERIARCLFDKFDLNADGYHDLQVRALHISPVYHSSPHTLRSVRGPGFSGSWPCAQHAAARDGRGLQGAMQRAGRERLRSWHPVWEIPSDLLGSFVWGQPGRGLYDCVRESASLKIGTILCFHTDKPNARKYMHYNAGKTLKCIMTLKMPGRVASMHSSAHNGGTLLGGPDRGPRASRPPRPPPRDRAWYGARAAPALTPPRGARAAPVV